MIDQKSFFNRFKSLTVPDRHFIPSACHMEGLVSFGWCQFERSQFHPELAEKLQLPLPEIVGKSALKRQAEYLASRWLVRECLKPWGYSSFQLSNREDRSPIWPSAIQGALSHHNNNVFCVLGPEDWLIGNDIEHYLCESRASEILPLVMDAAEQSLLKGCGLAVENGVTLLFSAKEALYKALAPRVKRYIDFLDVELCHIDHQVQRLTFRFKQENGIKASDGQPPLPLEWQVNYAWLPQEVVCWITQPLASSLTKIC